MTSPIEEGAVAPTEAASEGGDVVSLLVQLLGSTVQLYLTTLVAHWNVEGRQFFSIHRAFGKQYEALQEDADRIAERLRALEETIEVDSDPLHLVGETNAEALAGLLLEKRTAAAELAREVHAKATEKGDVATAMLMEELALRHEKTAWMLRSFLA